MVGKMLRYAAPPGYQRQQPVKRPKLGPWLGAIDAILEQDKTRAAKQRHTAKRIFDRLRDEHGFTGGYGIVSQYVRGEQLRGREMFVPLVHPAGEAQADFGEALVVIAGVEQKAHYLAMDLPHSDDCFVIAFPAETTEAFLPPQRRRPVAGGPGRRPCSCLCLFWLCSHTHSLRQHEDRGSQDSGRRRAAEDPRVF
jgi:transposase